VSGKRRIYRDYLIQGGDLVKLDVDEGRHLLGQVGRTPCIDAERVWDKFFPAQICGNIVVTTTKGRTFRISAYKFNRWKQVIDLGFGRQYWVPREHWDIEEPEGTLGLFD
jgi:hypothetical protein